ncbi:MAG: hypothetical protein NC092_10575 [Butyrivibrio sp.]|nr:hypothetical protein [Muribaculum sp.]MCM1553124.1 hypothetical protein [Butyrivibrio sp.]
MKKFKMTVPYILAILMSLFVAFPAISNSIVLDEAYSVYLVQGSVSDIIQGAAKDVHPPLYYLILKFFNLFGSESLFKYRLVTALGTWLNLLLIGATMVRKQWGCRTSVLYILWFSLTYGTLEKTTLIRMYSWGAFFVTAAAVFIFLYYQNDRKRDLILGAVMTLAAMYTHYYALIAVFFIWLFLLLIVLCAKRERLGAVFLGGIAVTVGYLPWLGKLLAQSRRVATNYWISEFDWNEWKMVPAALMERSDDYAIGIGMVLYALLMIILLLAFVRKKWDSLLCVAVFVCTMLTGALLSVLVTPIWMTRYMYVGWGLIALFVAIVVGEVSSSYSNISQSLLILVLAITGVVSLNTMLNDETIANTADEWIAFLAENVESDSYIIIDDPNEHRLVYSFYLPDAELVFTEKWHGQEIEENLSKFLRQSSGHQLWYIVDYRQQKIGVERMKDYLNELGYTTQSTGFYVIKQKELEIFRIEEMQNDK